MSIHAEWLSLIEISGAFLAEPILDQAFPQGLEGLETSKKQAFRQTYDEWREALDTEDELQAKLHEEWINWVLKTGLEWDEDDEGEELKAGVDVPPSLKLDLLEHNLTLKPDYALFGNDTDKPYLLVVSYPAHVDLNNVVVGDAWSTTPAERMSHLCRATGTRLGLVTNGEQWMIVDAPEGGITSYASWYARLWSQEPVTLKAFFSLLNIRTVFSGFGLEGQKLTELLDNSLKHQDEVTETLGAQVQRAVEVLIQSIDRINNDSNGELLDGVEPSELYEAGLTYMMRLVFLLCAEERGLLLLGDETYEANYAVSTLRMKLRDEAGLHGEEVLSYRNNAWARLLAVFRAVYGGVEHEDMRMPALGGSLFDPDRFPFLEGRSKGSSWKVDAARPLPIDNRTVLLFLDAIQIFKGRTLSYRALDVEQIGYVYEGLLERTVIRSPDVTLELKATKNAKKTWLLLGELESARLDGSVAVKELLKERTGSSATRISNDLAKNVSEDEADKLLLACQNDTDMRDRIIPYYNFLRMDAWNNPLLYLKNTFIVTTGSDRRETGAHYTPKLLTESIVKKALDSIVYIGPSEGKERQVWQVIPPDRFLDLKICDLAMGSGAFLVQVCRYLSDRLLESWAQAELTGKVITLDGIAVEDSEDIELLTHDAEERHLIARRLISERCLYGVDVNPLAVELAKLSIWLVTLAKNRPFGFLDHNLKCGDSLLGVTNIEQLSYLNFNPTKLSEGGGVSKQLFSQKVEEAVKNVITLRLELRKRRIFDIHDIDVMANLDQQVREKLELPELVADALVVETLKAGGKTPNSSTLSIESGQVFNGDKDAVFSLKKRVNKGLNNNLQSGSKIIKPFHWCLEFPEVFNGSAKGFDAVVGNPPFLGGQKLTDVFGKAYREFLVNYIVDEKRGSADLCVYFFMRAFSLLGVESNLGLIGTKSLAEGDNREVGLESVIENKGKIFDREVSLSWPGQAAVIISLIWIRKGKWSGSLYNSKLDLQNDNIVGSYKVSALSENDGLAYIGSQLSGEGFKLSKLEADNYLKECPECIDVIAPILRGEDVTSEPSQRATQMVINFGNRTEEDTKKYGPCYLHVKNKVYPERHKVKRDSRRLRWWMYAERSEKMYKKISSLDEVIVHPSPSKYICPAIVPSNQVFSAPMVVFTSSSRAIFACLQSNAHWLWVVANSSKLGETQRYTPSDSLRTFPFPENINGMEVLYEIGAEYESLRKVIMRSRDIGVTGLYNLFHDKECSDSKIKELCRLQVKLDEAVLKAYGWSDISMKHGFYRLAYLPTGKSMRFTICDQAREEIYSRLLTLNKERSKGQLKGSKINKKNNNSPVTSQQINIFE
ncbi:Eco57I restriction-modification methylase domain-containing protein [Leucothrix arctica]|uniref:Eco57I restriction-modification methylase domain-containing protein n=1 Tax=Leucothrix arctica TaxID=1481894 RepID=UPI001BAD1783|nr:type IIL restriction-modification enzyme MmeI [Leucothrix arctica]